MAFTLPDNDVATNANQSIIMRADVTALVAGIGGDGVRAGADVTAQGTPDMTVAVAAGTARIGGVSVTIAAGNVTVTAANATNPRIDLIVVNNAGAKSCTAGTPAANPKAPDIPASSILLAMVYVPANQTTITAGLITDKRLLILPVPFSVGRLVIAGTTYLSIPGVSFISVTTAALSTGQDRYFPIMVPTTMTIDQLVCEVTTAGAGSTTIRMAIFVADPDGVPGALIVDGGTVTADATGFKTATVSAVLTPGRYYMALNSDGGPTLRMIRGGIGLGALGSALGASPFVSALRATRTYAAFPSTGTAIGTVSLSGTPFEYLMALRISVP